jgi:hypothetical protein
MESLLETVDLDIEESNELTFRIKMEGVGTNPVKVRLVCEDKDVSYMFSGYGTGEDGVVQFVLPQMKNKLNEGLHQAKVEVLVDNRYFSPVQFQINFKKTMNVVAESMFVAPKPPPRQEIKVSAQPITVRQLSKEPVNAPIPTIEDKPRFQQPIEEFVNQVQINPVQVKRSVEKSSTQRIIERDLTRRSTLAAAVDSDEKLQEIARTIRFKNSGR